MPALRDPSHTETSNPDGGPASEYVACVVCETEVAPKRLPDHIATTHGGDDE